MSVKDLTLENGNPDFEKAAEIARSQFAGFNDLVLFAQTTIMVEILVGNCVPGRKYTHDETIDFASRYLEENFGMMKDWGVEK